MPRSTRSTRSTRSSRTSLKRKAPSFTTAPTATSTAIATSTTRSPPTPTTTNQRRKRPRRTPTTVVANPTSATTAKALLKSKLNTQKNAQTNKRKLPTHILDLPDDALRSIYLHLMHPPHDAYHRPVFTPTTLSQSLSLSFTCTTLYKIRTSLIHSLDLSLPSSSTHCMVNMSLVSVLNVSNSNLRRLSLRRCNEVNNSMINLLLKSIGFKLIVIDLSFTNVDDEGLITLFKKSNNLSSLSINGCPNITEFSIEALANSYKPNLTFLDVSNNPQAITDKSLNKLLTSKVTSINSINTLILSNNRTLTDKTLHTISSSTITNSLQSITLRNLPLITDIGIKSLCMSHGNKLCVLDVLDSVGLTLSGHFSSIRKYCPLIFKFIRDKVVGFDHLRDCIIATMPGLIYRISATDAIRRLPALYFLLLDESALSSFRIAVQGRSLNLSDFGVVLVSNFGKKPSRETRSMLKARFGHGSVFDAESDDDESLIIESGSSASSSASASGM